MSITQAGKYEAEGFAFKTRMLRNDAPQFILNLSKYSVITMAFWPRKVTKTEIEPPLRGINVEKALNASRPGLA